MDGEFDIVYEKPANAQTVTLDLDDTSAGVSLDRTNYSQGTDVVITIDDQALNVDPTDTDTWFFTTGGDPVYVVVTSADDADTVTTNADDIGDQAEAQTTRDQAIADAQTAYEMATGNAEGIRDMAIADAQDDLDAVKMPLPIFQAYLHMVTVLQRSKIGVKASLTLHRRHTK